MSTYNPDCLGQYDFEHIAYFARKRFIEGCRTIDLLMQAKSQREKEEIALVATMDLDDDEISNLNLTCRYADDCHVTTCREVIRDLIYQNLQKLPEPRPLQL